MFATNDIVFSYQRDAVRLTLRSRKALGRMPRAISHQPLSRRLRSRSDPASFYGARERAPMSLDD